MKIKKTPLESCYIIEPDIFKDDRGYFFEAFNKDKFKHNSGIEFNPVQLNQSGSFKNVFRGFHFQRPPFEQSKLISCTEGEILDIAVDLRQSSATFGRYFSIVLSDSNYLQFYIPKGFAHGFLVISDFGKIQYLIDVPYSPEHDDGIIYNDPMINIDWKALASDLILSAKDKMLPTINEKLKNV